jgi:hypothetical protein
MIGFFACGTATPRSRASTETRTDTQVSSVSRENTSEVAHFSGPSSRA